MRFCKNCGAAAEEKDQQFCKACGFSLNEQTGESISDGEATSQVDLNKELDEVNEPNYIADEQPHNPKKNKWWLYALIAAVVLLGIAHFAMKSYVNPTKTIKAMDEDFQKENKKGFLDHFDYSSKTHADADSFYDFVEEQSWGDLRSGLLVNAEAVKNGDLTDPILDNDGNNLFKLIKEPVLGGLYNKVSFEVVPTRVEIASEFDKVQFTSEKEKVELDGKEPTYIGEFLPGEYKWSALLKASLGDIPFDGKMKVGREAESNKEEIELDIKPAYTTILTNNNDAELLVNGKETEFDFYSEDSIGPLPLDGSVTIQAVVTDGGTKHKTDVHKVKEKEVELNFKYLVDQQVQEKATEELETLAYENAEKIESFYQDFRKAYESDVNNHVYNAVPSYVVAGTALDKQYAGYFVDFTEDDRIDNYYNNLSDLQAVDQKTFKFDTAEDYTFYSHKGTTIDYSFKKTYTLVKSGTSYKINAIDSKKVSQNEY